MMRRAAIWVCGLLVVCVGAAAAATPSIPSALQDWQAWVLHGHAQQTCTLLASPSGGSGHQCVWPARLSLSAGRDGAQFKLGVRVEAESWVALPGNRDAWPQQVQVDGKPAVVLNRDGVPTLRLAAGDHVVQGGMHWDARPARLQMPESIALVDLTVDGKPIAQPERNDGWITLGPGAAQQRQADALSLRVFRKLSDGMPPTLETVLQLHVAGSAREQLLGPALPPGFVATSLDGDLPARMDPDGRLRVQLRPGDWSLTLDARGTATLAKLHFTPPPAPWPQQEIWSYADAPALRTTRVSGAQPIDPGQANVPSVWRNLPAYVMAKGSTLDVEQRVRGRSDAGDRLHLQEALWLDFDGKGVIADSRITGSLLDADRLDVAAPWALAYAQGGAADETLLVTHGDKPGTTGVELRSHVVDLRAGLRLPGHGGAHSATGGWQQTFDDVNAVLHLPYGYRLLGAPGADRSPDSWVARWNLLDLFIAAVIALLVWRLLGWQWALVALAFVVLSHGEPGAPRWTPAIAVVMGLIAKSLPDGRLRKWVRYLGMAALALAVLATLPFAAVQLRDALHPQLESSQLAWIGTERGARAGTDVATAYAPPPAQEQTVMSTPVPPPAPPPPADMAASAGIVAKAEVRANPQTLQSIVVTGSQIPAIVAAGGYPPGIVVQSGRGVPDWANFGSSYRLGWSGPVTAQQTWRMVILPAWATRILRVVMLALLVAWLAALARAFGLQARLPRGSNRGAAGVAAMLLLLALAPQARADSTPSPQLLSQLQARLLEAPKCAPQCASSPLAQVSVQDDALQVTVEADAAARVAFPLPHMDAPATLASVALDGKPAGALANRDGTLWIALDRGVHRVTLQFGFGAGAGSAALHFPLPPPQVQVASPGWQVAGDDGTRLLSDSLTFTRLRPTQNVPGAVIPAQAFPPYVKLVRNIAIGLDSRITNVATRVSPAQAGFTVSVPLLPGEHVSDPGINVTAGKALIAFGPGEDSVAWSGTLDAKDSLKLTAPPLGDRAEVWRISSVPLLHLGFTGVPESAVDDAASDVHVFRPLPGETLNVAISRPPAVPGDSVAFDHVTMLAVRGEHALETTLTLVTRSTRGGEQGLQLPRGALLLAAQRDGQTLQLNPREGHVTLPVQPGVQTFTLRFRDTSALGLLSRTPAVSVDAPFANIRTTLGLPHDRWVLWTWGPQAGPAVLYWSQLIVLLIVAIALAKFAPAPLRWWHWLLLGLGFSIFAWSAFALVAVWLIVLGLRARSDAYAALTRSPFNALQILIAVFTFIALLCLVAAVPYGLLGRPDMRIAGLGSTSAALNWFADQGHGALPRAGAFTLPLWAYKAAMLAWALWLAFALIGWLRWGFDAWMRGGYWKSAPIAPQATLAERVATDKDHART
jgi:hypothetical protein